MSLHFHNQFKILNIYLSTTNHFMLQKIMWFWKPIFERIRINCLIQKQTNNQFIFIISIIFSHTWISKLSSQRALHHHAIIWEKGETGQSSRSDRQARGYQDKDYGTRRCWHRDWRIDDGKFDFLPAYLLVCHLPVCLSICLVAGRPAISMSTCLLAYFFCLIAYLIGCLIDA